MDITAHYTEYGVKSEDFTIFYSLDVNWLNDPAKAIKAAVGGLRMMQIIDAPSNIIQLQPYFV